MCWMVHSDKGLPDVFLSLRTTVFLPSSRFKSANSRDCVFRNHIIILQNTVCPSHFSEAVQCSTISLECALVRPLCARSSANSVMSDGIRDQTFVPSSKHLSNSSMDMRASASLIRAVLAIVIVFIFCRLAAFCFLSFFFAFSCTLFVPLPSSCIERELETMEMPVPALALVPRRETPSSTTESSEAFCNPWILFFRAHLPLNDLKNEEGSNKEFSASILISFLHVFISSTFRLLRPEPCTRSAQNQPSNKALHSILNIKQLRIKKTKLFNGMLDIVSQAFRSLKIPFAGFFSQASISSIRRMSRLVFVLVIIACSATLRGSWHSYLSNTCSIKRLSGMQKVYNL
ncbi:hypothetical protein NECID01_1094 [Nematocida sp. AWRm77]|nr:hypothetical protein NECID01_1094 [Nematocida sp. AWRm77]